MQYTELGGSGIRVSRFCLGCMSFGDPASEMHAWTLNADESEAIIRHALGLGINFFDTANCYSAGTSEEYLGRAIRRNVAREKVVLASKVYFNEGHLSKAAIEREIDGTLKRLGTDYLDLYIIHRFDASTPVGETMSALDGLVKAGKVRALGASAMYGYQFYNMQLCTRDNGLTPLRIHAEPLQSAVQGRREGAYPRLQTDERGAHTVQPARRGQVRPPELGGRHAAQPHR